MGYKRLFIWVEGDDDKDFFERIIKPIFEKKYDWIAFIRYAQMPTKKRIKFLESIKSKSMNADYIYIADINNQTPCVTLRKQKIHAELKNIDKDKIIVVIMEIENWYLAGLDDTNAKNLKIPIHVNTDTITKEQFNRLIPKKFDRRDFMLEILNCFSIRVAKQKNRSFKYFVEKYISNVR
jgi:hypothetical protein